MDFSRLFIVFEVCLPVFGLIGLGVLLRRKQIITDDRRDFITTIVYNLGLPSLIFAQVAVQPFSELLNGPLIAATFGATAFAFTLSIIIALLARFRGGVGAATVFGTFWGNTSFIGFPLALGAFGDHGLALAAIVAAFTVPFFILLAYIAVGLFAKAHGDARATVKAVLVNPIVLSGLLGVVFSYVKGQWPHLPVPVPLHEAVAYTCRVGLACLKLIGSMGLPLALMAVGASLSVRKILNNQVPLMITVASKTVLTPLAAMIIMLVFFPHADRAVLGIAVLLMAMPTAVASFIISSRLGVAQDFVGGVVVVSTLATVATVPIWLYFVI